jgi:hypothetical protein
MGACGALSSSNLSVLDTDSGHPEHQSGCDGQITAIRLFINGMGLAHLSGEDLFAKGLKFQALPHKC